MSNTVTVVIEAGLLRGLLEHNVAEYAFLQMYIPCISQVHGDATSSLGSFLECYQRQHYNYMSCKWAHFHVNKTEAIYTKTDLWRFHIYKGLHDEQCTHIYSGNFHPGGFEARNE